MFLENNNLNTLKILLREDLITYDNFRFLSVGPPHHNTILILRTRYLFLFQDKYGDTFEGYSFPTLSVETFGEGHHITAVNLIKRLVVRMNQFHLFQCLDILQIQGNAALINERPNTQFPSYSLIDSLKDKLNLYLQK